MKGAVRDALPPAAVLAILNPLMKALLRSRASRAIGGLALIEFPGSRTGRRLSVVVGWHTLDGTPVAFTPARWRTNFAGGAAAAVRWRGRDEEHVGTLESDAEAVAQGINAVVRDGTSPRALGLRVPAGQAVTADDVRRTGRTMVRFRPVG